MENAVIAPCLRQKQAAEYLGLSEKTLERDRQKGEFGIPYIKLGRAVVYKRASLDEWIAAQPVRRSTSDRAEAA